MFSFHLDEIRPQVYHIQMDDSYDLAMLFLRYQEYYESPKWRKVHFTLLDFIEWYSKEYGKGAFTYAKDWKGFNIPDWAISEQLFKTWDRNHYDSWMQSIRSQIVRRGSEKFYLIGTCTADKDHVGTIQHELAHAYYYLHPQDYALEVRYLLTGQDDKRHIGVEGRQIRDAVEEARPALLKLGYHRDVIVDEMQAYFATGPSKKLKEIITPDVQRRFADYFRRFDQCQKDRMQEEECPTKPSK